MVAVVVGKGLGLENSSAYILGSQGMFGNAVLGRSGEQVYVNGATGNLVITRQDEFLIGNGPDLGISRTYNSLGDMSDDNGDNWRMGVYRKVSGLSGTYGGTGTTVTRTDWDGSVQTYTWNATASAYVTTDGAGAYDKLTRSSGVWTWTDGDTQIAESYDDSNGGRITARTDTDGNGLSYTYTSGLITRITSTNGSQTDDYVDFVYSGTLLTKLETHAGGTTTRVFYTYDAQNRLSQVKVNLDPGDNSASSGDNYITSYTYVDSTSRRIASITQTDGSVLTIGYSLVGSDYKVTSLQQAIASGLTRSTSINYGSGGGTVSSPEAVFGFEYDSNKQLTHYEDPTQYEGRFHTFSYSTKGDVEHFVSGPRNALVSTYDINGNRVSETDNAGNRIERIYSATNKLLVETRFLVPDPDFGGPGSVDQGVSTRYGYDEDGHLTWRVTPEGRVTQYVIETNPASLGYGQVIATIEYLDLYEDISELAVTEEIDPADLIDWVDEDLPDLSRAVRTEFTYDYRGAVISTTSYSKLQSDGTFDTSSERVQTLYTYDQAGNLLTRQQTGSSATETYFYDGMNRIVSATDFHNIETTFVYDDDSQTTVIALANGLVKTSTYNLAGDLTSYVESGTAVPTSTTLYHYDTAGRVLMTEDSTGNRTHLFYDAFGRNVATIDGDGSFVEYRYDNSDNVTSVTHYATRLNSTELAALVDDGEPIAGYPLSIARPEASLDDRWNWSMYDDAQRLVRTIDGTGAVTTYSYDGASRLIGTRQYAERISQDAIALLKAAPTSINNNEYLDAPLGITPDPTSPAYWDPQNLIWSPTTPINGLDAFELMATTWYDPASVEFVPTFYAEGKHYKFVMEFTLQAFNTAGKFHQFLISNSENPEAVDADVTIVSGPGSLTDDGDGQWTISDVKTYAPTTIRIERYLQPQDSLNVQFFIRYRDPTVDEDGVLNQRVILSNPVGAIWEYFPPELPEEDAGDLVTRFFYDDDGNAIGTLDAEGYLTQTVYDATGRKVETIAYADDVDGDPEVRAQGDFETLYLSVDQDEEADIHNYFVYDARGMLRAAVDGELTLTRYRYNAFGQLDQVLYGQKLGTEDLTDTYADLPNPDSGEIVERTDYTTDQYGRVLTETRYLASASTTVITNVYDDMGQLVSRTTQTGGPDPRISMQRYDQRGRLTAEMLGIGGALIAALGPDPDPEVADPIWAEYATFYGYDTADRLIAISNANGDRTLFYYDADGRVALQVGATGEVSEYRYNAFGERSDAIRYGQRIDGETLSEMTGGAAASMATTLSELASAALDAHVQTAFHVTGTVKAVTDTYGEITDFNYDVFGNLVERTAPSGDSEILTTSFFYDRRGLLTTEIVDNVDGGRSITTLYGYDAFGRAISLTNAETHEFHREYDRAGRLVSVTDALDHTTSYTYDARGNLVAVTNALEQVSRSVYDMAGRLTWSVDATGGVVRTDYDDDGRVAAVTAYANRISLVGLGAEISEEDITTLLVTDAQDDRTVRNLYDLDGRLRFVLDDYLNPVEYRYDDVGNLIATTVYEGAIDATGTYSAAYVESEIIDEALTVLAVTRGVFDRAGRQTFAINGVGTVTENVYDTSGRVIKQLTFAAAFEEPIPNPTDDEMRTWILGNADAERDQVARAVYDEGGRLRYSVNAEGYVTEYRYNLDGTVERRIDYETPYSIADGDTVEDVATLIGAPSSTAVTRFIYDSAGRLNETIDAMGTHTVFTLDQLGQILATTFAAGEAEETVTTRIFDAAGRIESETEADGSAAERTTLFGYDAADRRTSTIAAHGTADAVTWAWQYDATGRVTREIRGDGSSAESETAYVYNAFGEIETATLADGTADEATTRYDYDRRGLLSGLYRAEATPYAEELLYTHDALGRLRLETLADGTEISRTYDAAGRLKDESIPVDGNPAHDLTTHRDYDAFGNVIAFTDARGNVTEYEYDLLNRVVAETDAEAIATTTDYTWHGQINSVTRDAATTSFGYDKLGRLTDVEDAEVYAEHYDLDRLGRRTSVLNKLNGTTDYTYDALGRVTSQTVYMDVYDSTGTLIDTEVRTDYTYDLRGNLKSKTEGANFLGQERLTSYDYDALDRLTHIDRPNAYSVEIGMYMTSVTHSMEDNFTYDRRGNLIIAEVAGQPTVYSYYDLLDRKVAQLDESGKLTRWTYDESGNVEAERVYDDPVTFPGTRDAEIPSPVDIDAYRETSFAYDKAGRLISTSSLAVWTWGGPGEAFDEAAIVREIDYDEAGNVIREAMGDAETRSFYDKANRKIGQLDAEGYLTVWERDAEGNATKETRFALRPEDPIAQNVTVAQLYDAAEESGDDRITLFEYDLNGRRTKETRVGVNAWLIDGNNELDEDETLGHADATIEYQYNGFGQVVRKIEANGDATDYSYDDQGQLITITAQSFEDHLGATVTPETQLSYDAFGGVVRTSINKEGGSAGDARVTTYEYDKLGRAITVTQTVNADPGDNIVHFYDYDAGGRVVRDRYGRERSDGTGVTEAVGYFYDVAGRLTGQTVATKGNQTPPTPIKWTFGDQLNLRYNVHGELTGRGINFDASFDPVYQETYDYDRAGRLWRTNSGDGAIKIMVYDARGNVGLTLTSAGADLSGLSFTDVRESIDATGDGNTDISGAVVAISMFDKRGQEIETSAPDRQIGYDELLSSYVTADIGTSRDYNAFGEVVSETDARGNTTDYAYNSMGRLVSKQGPLADWTDEEGVITNERLTEHYYYDVAGRLIGFRNMAGHDSRRELLAGTGHGGTEALVTVDHHFDDETSYTLYDVFGDARILRNELWTGTGDDLTETDVLQDFDKLGRLVQVKQLGRQVFDQFHYDLFGQELSRTRDRQDGGDDIVSTTDYDRQGRVTKTIDFGGIETTYSYGWDRTIATGALGTFGGWTKTTTHAPGLSSSETTDFYSRTISRTDLGGFQSDFTYDEAGRLTELSVGYPTFLPVQTTSYAYLDSGRLLSLSTGVNDWTRYDYDESGNLIAEQTTRGGDLVQNGIATYDELNRITSWTEENGDTPAASLSWEYDQVGNIRRAKAAYRALNDSGVADGTDSHQDNWYLYDAMNRVTTDRGELIDDSGSTILKGDDARGTGEIRRQTVTHGAIFGNDQFGGGTDYTYDAVGRRTSMARTQWQFDIFSNTMFSREQKEMYDYTAEGYLAQTRVAYGAQDFVTMTPPSAGNIGDVVATFSYDGLGRLTEQVDYDDSSSIAYHRYDFEYDDNGLVLKEKNQTYRSTGVFRTEIENKYEVGGVYYLGAVTESKAKNYKTSTLESTVTTTNSYNWREGAVLESQVLFTDYPSGGPTDTYFSNGYAYDAGGQLVQVTVVEGTGTRYVNFINDMSGQALRRDQVDPYSTGEPHEIWYRFGGKQVGYVGNNGTSETSYPTSIGLRTATPGTGQFGGGSTTGLGWADFGLSQSPITSTNQGSNAASYRVQAGDTLQSIAANLWGDASLWYKLAEANGLSAGSQLIEGRSLVVPAGVMRNTNNAQTFKPYDPNEVLGNVAPTAPKAPKKPKCAALGAILVVAIAIAITLIIKLPVTQMFQSLLTAAGATTATATGVTLTAAAATTATVAGAVTTAVVASAVSQGIGVATGLQKDFSWKGVALAGISAGIGAALPGSDWIAGAGSFVNDAVRGAVTNAATQGVGVLTGLQKKFSWAGVAAAGIVSGVSGAVTRALPLGPKFSDNGAMTQPAGNLNAQISNSIGAVAGAVTRTLLGGRSFGDNLLAILPDVIGSTIGSVVGGAIKSALFDPPADLPKASYAGPESESEGPGESAPAATPSPAQASAAVPVAETEEPLPESAAGESEPIARMPVRQRGESQATFDARVAAEDERILAQREQDRLNHVGDPRFSDRNTIAPYAGMPAMRVGATPWWMILRDFNVTKDDGTYEHPGAFDWLVRQQNLDTRAGRATLTNKILDETAPIHLTRFVIPFFERFQSDSRAAEMLGAFRERARYLTEIADKEAMEILYATPLGEIRDFVVTANEVIHNRAPVRDLILSPLESRLKVRQIRGIVNEIGDVSRGMRRRADDPRTLPGRMAVDAGPTNPIAVVASRLEDSTAVVRATRRGRSVGRAADGPQAVRRGTQRRAAGAEGPTPNGQRSATASSAPAIRATERSAPARIDSTPNTSSTRSSGAVEGSRGDQQYTADLSGVTGRTAQQRERAISAVIREDFSNLRLTFRPQYSPHISYGVAQQGAGTQIGRASFTSRRMLRDTIVHEELHHRWWKRGLMDHHPLNSDMERKFYGTVERYMRMRGW